MFKVVSHDSYAHTKIVNICPYAKAKKYYMFSYFKCALRVLKIISAKFIAYVLQQHLFLASSSCYSFQWLFIARCNYIISRCRSTIIVQVTKTEKEWWNAMKIMRISSPSHIIWASDDPRSIQSLDVRTAGTHCKWPN